MKWLTLKLIKLNSRIDGNEEDELLELYGESAEEQVLADTRRTYDELVAMGGGEKVPASITRAALMLADQAYIQRCTIDRIQWSLVPYAYEKCIKIYKRLAGPDQLLTDGEG